MTLRIGYVVLAHQDPPLVARLARVLLAGGGVVSIHYDQNGGAKGLAALKAALGDDAVRVHWPKREKVGWGEWSIVQATLNALEALAASGEAMDYVHLMSGTDYPIRPLAEFEAYLAAKPGIEFIECVDMAAGNWVKGGLTHERYQYRHRFNWKKSRALFDRDWTLQRRLGLKRSFPAGLKPHLGSQWWTLSWRTIEAVLKAGRDRKLVSFFRTVWIPDEMFIQTVVACAPHTPVTAAKNLTLYQFTDKGVPVVYANDHADHLARQPFFFARKISAHADRLRDELDAQVMGTRPVRRFDVDRFGIRTDEYERHRQKWAKPIPGVRLLGYEPDHWRGDLANVERPVIAVFGASREELGFIAALLNRTGRVVCHGALFHPKRIEFVGGSDGYAGYKTDDTTLRDNRRTTFLYDIVNAVPESMTPGFLAPWGTDEQIRDRLVWSGFSRILIVRGNVVRAFAEYCERNEIPLDGSFAVDTGTRAAEPAAAMRLPDDAPGLPAAALIATNTKGPNDDDGVPPAEVMAALQSEVVRPSVETVTTIATTEVSNPPGGVAPAAPASTLLPMDAAKRTPTVEFDRFRAEYEDYHARLWTACHDARVPFKEIDLTWENWLPGIFELLERDQPLLPAVASRLRREVAVSRTSELGDPYRRIPNALTLIRTRVDEGRRAAHLRDYWRGDLATVRKPIVAVFGASHEELRFIAGLLDRTGVVTCHGALFHPREIEFAGGAGSYAGYRADDVTTRDARRMSFLCDVALEEKSDKAVGLLVPWATEDLVREHLVSSDVCRILIVRGNLLRAMLEYRERTTTSLLDDGVGERLAPRSIPVGEFQKFLGEYSDYHAKLWAACNDAKAIFKEIDLMGGDWLQGILDLVEYDRAIPAGMMRGLTPAFVAEQARALSAPHEQIQNATWLLKTWNDEWRRNAHLLTIKVAREAAETGVDQAGIEAAPPRALPAPNGAHPPSPNLPSPTRRLTEEAKAK